jgi:hypothetical protein
MFRHATKTGDWTHSLCDGALVQQVSDLHWPIDDYQQGGLRHNKWMTDDVIKYPRTTSTYINPLIDSGFTSRSFFKSSDVAMSVCAGARHLAKLGPLNGQVAAASRLHQALC